MYLHTEKEVSKKKHSKVRVLRLLPFHTHDVEWHFSGTFRPGLENVLATLARVKVRQASRETNQIPVDILKTVRRLQRVQDLPLTSSLYIPFPFHFILSFRPPFYTYSPPFSFPSSPQLPVSCPA